MALDNCSKCGKLYQRISRPLCPDCLREEEELAEKVVDYLRAHSGATIEKITEATEVDEGFVLKLLRDGRIQMANGVRPDLLCQACGAKIKSGMYCTDCVAKFGRAFAGTDGLDSGLGRSRRDDADVVAGSAGGTQDEARDTLKIGRRSSGTRMVAPQRRRRGR